MSALEPIAVGTLAPEHLSAVASLERTVSAVPWRIEHFARIIELEWGLGIVATAQRGEVVGYAVGWVASDEAELANIAVVADRRGQGIGGRILTALRGAAEERGARRLYLDVRASNESAIALYQKYGFEIVGRRSDYYSQPREDALVMAVDLTSREAYA